MLFQMHVWLHIVFFWNLQHCLVLQYRTDYETFSSPIGLNNHSPALKEKTGMVEN